MHEIELKFQVPPGRRAAIDAAVAGHERRARVHLQAAYYDTADRALAEAGLALRIRHEGRHWVQTLKGAGADSLTRAEHNVTLPAAPAEGVGADPALHAASEVGQRLLALLGGHPSPALLCVFGTDIRRRSRQLRTRQGVVELAFDEGAIVAGERQLAVCELEIELVSGSPLAVIATARQWVRRHGLWLDTRSKAERGDLLARAQRMAPPRGALPVRLSKAVTTAQGLRGVLLSCLDQIAVNASQVASGEHDGEHVHQLRVGLRRLRTALRLFAPAIESQPYVAPMAEQAATLFRALGAARDLVAIAEPMERELAGALQAAGLSFQSPTLPIEADAEEPTSLLRGAPAQQLLLDLFERTQTAPPAAGADAPTLRRWVADRLQRWHRKTVDDASRFAALDDASRHRLRRRVKRLRYSVEFVGDLFERRRVRRYLKPLRALQERLGALVDITVALDAYRGSSDSDPHALFAVGWLAACKDRLLHDSEPDMAAFGEVKRFWKR